MKPFFCFTSVLVLGFFTWVSARGEFSTTSSSQLKAIEVNYTTVGGFRYYTDENPYITDKDLGEMLTPLRDYEINRLFQKSQSSQSISGILNLAGMVGVATGLVGLLAAPSDQQAPYLVTAIGGAVVFDIGSFFKTESQTAKFNCVQRYNRFARGQEQTLPPAADEKSLMPSGDTSLKATLGDKKP